MWDLTDLHIFRVVVAEGGITMAARKLHRVPSSVTMRIKHLEASVGTQLFFRSKQRLHVSPSGEVLLAFAAQLLRLSEEAHSALAGSAPRGVLRLGALESTTASRLPDGSTAKARRLKSPGKSGTTWVSNFVIDFPSLLIRSNPDCIGSTESLRK